MNFDRLFANGIVEVARNDFVDKYVGWSSVKTMRLLEKNHGEVLLVSEPIMKDYDDLFGYEAMKEIDNYLSKYPEEIAIVFIKSKNEN